MLWLLASEYKDGIIDASMDKIAFRLSMKRDDLVEALTPLIQSDFFNASEALAECYQSAIPEKERDIEKKEEIEKEKKDSPSLRSDDWPSDYGDQFWKAYPRKTEKLSAMRKLATVRKSGTVTFAELMAGVNRYAATKTEPQYTKHPTTWLNAGCWADEIQPGANNGQQSNHQRKTGHDAILAAATRKAREMFGDGEMAGGTDESAFPFGNGTESERSRVPGKSVNGIGAGHNGGQPAASRVLEGEVISSDEIAFGIPGSRQRH